MGLGKIVFAGVGGLVVGGTMGAALAAGGVHAGSKSMEAQEAKKSNEDALKISTERENLAGMRSKRLHERGEAGDSEAQRLQSEREAAEAEVAEAMEQREQLLIAMLAVGMAAGSVDGPMSAASRYELEQAMEMVKENDELPAAVVTKLKEYDAKAPTFMKAKKEVDKLKDPNLRLFRALIDNIIHSDGVVSPKEVDFLEKWSFFFAEEKAGEE